MQPEVKLSPAIEQIDRCLNATDGEVIMQAGVAAFDLPVSALRHAQIHRIIHTSSGSEQQKLLGHTLKRIFDSGKLSAWDVMFAMKLVKDIPPQRETKLLLAPNLNDFLYRALKTGRSAVLDELGPLADAALLENDRLADAYSEGALKVLKGPGGKIPTPPDDSLEYGKLREKVLKDSVLLAAIKTRLEEYMASPDSYVLGIAGAARAWGLESVFETPAWEKSIFVNIHRAIQTKDWPQLTELLKTRIPQASAGKEGQKNGRIAEIVEKVKEGIKEDLCLNPGQETAPLLRLLELCPGKNYLSSGEFQTFIKALIVEKLAVPQQALLVTQLSDFLTPENRKALRASGELCAMADYAMQELVKIHNNIMRHAAGANPLVKQTIIDINRTLVEKEKEVYELTGGGLEFTKDLRKAPFMWQISIEVALKMQFPLIRKSSESNREVSHSELVLGHELLMTGLRGLILSMQDNPTELNRRSAEYLCEIVLALNSRYQGLPLAKVSESDALLQGARVSLAEGEELQKIYENAFRFSLFNAGPFNPHTASAAEHLGVVAEMGGDQLTAETLYAISEMIEDIYSRARSFSISREEVEAKTETLCSLLSSLPYFGDADSRESIRLLFAGSAEASADDSDDGFETDIPEGQPSTDS